MVAKQLCIHVMSFGLWIAGLGVGGYGFWIIGYGLCVMGCECSSSVLILRRRLMRLRRIKSIRAKTTTVEHLLLLAQTTST